MTKTKILRPKKSELKDIEIAFKTPTNGYWNGGIRSGGSFTPEVVSGGYEKHWGLKWHMKWGDFGLNHYFRLPPSRNVRVSAMRHLKRVTKVPFTFVKQA